MMSEKKWPTITVENLGPLKKIEHFEVKKINLVIGESASGKSLLAKAIFFFNYAINTTLLALSKNNFKEDFKINSKSLQDIIGKWKDDFFNPYQNYTMEYHYTADYSIRLDKGEVIISKGLEEKINDILTGTENRIKIISKQSKITGHTKLGTIQKELYVVYARIFYSEFLQNVGIIQPYFIPATRSFVSDFDTLRLRDLNRISPNFEKNRPLTGDVTLRLFSDDYRDFLRGFQTSDSRYEKILRGNLKKKRHYQPAQFVYK